MGWLTVMVRNRAIDHVRSRAREAPAMTEADALALENLPALLPDADQSADLRALVGCLGALHPQHAKAVLLAYYNGLSRNELASLLDIPENTIKTWLRRGLIALRQCMGEG
jgi:RNA polymerase sigma-70 factor (ECF subfamily)